MRDNSKYETVRERILDSDQFKMVKDEAKMLDALDSALPKMMAAMMEEIAEKRQHFWDNIAKFMGSDTEEEVELGNGSLEIDWLNKKILLKRPIAPTTTA